MRRAKAQMLEATPKNWLVGALSTGAMLLDAAVSGDPIGPGMPLRRADGHRDRLDGATDRGVTRSRAAI
jgi:hypothetical protein